MKTVAFAVLPVAAVGLVMLGCVVGTRIAARHRNPRSLIVVVDRRTFNEAARRIPRLVDAGGSEDRRVAYHGSIAVLSWLEHEAKTGRRSRRAWYQSQIADWRVRQAELAEGVGLNGLAKL